MFSSLSGLPAPRSSRDLAEIWPRSSRSLAEMSRDPAEIQPRSGRDRAEIGPRSEACLRRAAGRMHRRRWPPQSCSRRYRAPTRKCLGSVQGVSSILLSTRPCSYRAAYTSLGAGRRDRVQRSRSTARKEGGECGEDSGMPSEYSSRRALSGAGGEHTGANSLGFTCVSASAR